MGKKGRQIFIVLIRRNLCGLQPQSFEIFIINQNIVFLLFNMSLFSETDEQIEFIFQ